MNEYFIVHLYMYIDKIKRKRKCFHGCKLMIKIDLNNFKGFDFERGITLTLLYTFGT